MLKLKLFFQRNKKQFLIGIKISIAFTAGLGGYITYKCLKGSSCAITQNHNGIAMTNFGTITIHKSITTIVTNAPEEKKKLPGESGTKGNKSFAKKARIIIPTGNGKYCDSTFQKALITILQEYKEQVAKINKLYFDLMSKKATGERSQGPAVPKDTFKPTVESYVEEAQRTDFQKQKLAKDSLLLLPDNSLHQTTE